MKIIIAKNAGFCPGVNNAIKKVIEISEKTKKKVYTLGPLIHNKDVIKSLEEKEIKAVEDIGEIDDFKNSILVIRAHGIPPELEEKIKKTGIEVIDATCPLVKNVHKIIQEYKEKGYITIIVGDKNHAEVIGLKGYAGENSYVISSKEEAYNLPFLEKANIVSQTTQEEEFFYEIVEVIKPKIKEIVISNTICNPTKLRQKETYEYSRNCDLVIVIGGKHSANTQRLFQITSKLAKKSILIENENEIDFEKIKNKNTIFITAGASTPGWLIERVEKKIKEFTTRKNFIEEAFKFLIVSGIFTLLSTFALTTISYKIFMGSVNFNLSIAIALSLTSIHIINRKIEIETHEINLKKLLFLRFSNTISIIAYIFILTSLIISLFSGFKYFILITLFLTFGVIYSKIKKKVKISLTKELSISFGWVYMISLLPFLDSRAKYTLSFIIFSFFIFLSSMIRNIIITILHKHNDIIISPQTLLYRLGDSNTKIFLNISIVILILISFSFYNTKKTILFIPVYYITFLLLIKNKKIPDILLSEFLTELPFILLLLG